MPTEGDQRIIVASAIDHSIALLDGVVPRIFLDVHVCIENGDLCAWRYRIQSRCQAGGLITFDFSNSERMARKIAYFDDVSVNDANMITSRSNE